MMSALFQGASHYYHQPSGDYRLPLGPHLEDMPRIGETQNTPSSKQDGRSGVQNTMQPEPIRMLLICLHFKANSLRNNWRVFCVCACFFFYLKTCDLDILLLPATVIRQTCQCAHDPVASENAATGHSCRSSHEAVQQLAETFVFPLEGVLPLCRRSDWTGAAGWLRFLRLEISAPQS